MATPNYGYEKRQRELAKKRKQEEKRQRKQSGKAENDASEPVAGADPGGAGSTPLADDPAKPSALPS